MDFTYMFTTAEGRINRQPWWIGSIVLMVGSWLASFLTILLFGSDGLIGNLILVAVSVCILIASFMLSIKRCHDRDKSGWWCLLLLVPIVGFIWAIIDLGILEGTKGPNRFGPDPQAGQA